MLDARAPRVPDPLGHLEVSRFPGRVDAAERAGTPLASQAWFHGHAVVTLWPRADIEALLPPPFEPAPNPRLPDSHPVLFLFGDQRNGAVIYGGVTLASRVVYQEFTMAVPFARHRECGSLHLYLPCMVSSFRPAVLTGNRVYGFAKRVGRLTRHGCVCAVRDADGTLLFEAHVEPTTADGAAATRFDTLRRWLALPVTGRREDGRWVSSYWHFDVARARIRPARARVRVAAALSPGVAAGRHVALPGGAFEVGAMRWVLSWPSRAGF